MPRHRYTVSLVVEGRVAIEIDGLRRALGAESLRRIPPHITLVPPVNVSDEESAAAFEVVRVAASGAGPIAVSLGPVETFWPTNPVIYLAVGGDLEALGTLRDELLHPPLAPPAGRRERSFVPHVTIDQRASPSRIPPSLDALGDYREGFTFERLTLLEQDDAHRWQPQMDVALGRPATVARGGLALELGAARRLDPAEARWVDEHWAAYGRSQYGPGYEADDPYVIAARRQGSIVGAAVGEVRGEVCELSRLIVDATVRREGIGSQLLRAVDDFGAEHGCRKVRLKTVLGGVAEAFYAGRGFSRETVLPAWREGRDFVVLSRPAGPTSGVPRRSGAVEREV